MKNLIIIVLDDLGYKDLSFYGSELYTPSLDSLAESAIRFTQFNGQSVCSPARASLLSGLYGYKNGVQSIVWPWANPPVGLEPNINILPQFLKPHGYKTYMIGKWHLGFFTPAHRPNHRGFDYYYGSLSGIINYWTHTTDNGVYDLYENDQVVDKNDNHVTELQTQKAIQVLKKHDYTKPFFLYLPFNAPHGPNITFPYWHEHSYHNAPGGYTRNRPDRHNFGALLCHLDYCIGKIIHTLKKAHAFDDTFIWVTSDNGGTPSSDNTPLNNTKGSFYEGGLRLTNFLLGPGIQPGTNDVPHHLVDIMPTVFKLLNLPFNTNIDGIDVFGPQPQDREFIYYLRVKDTGSIIGCIRQGDYKLLKFDKLEMFNLKSDPNEKNNISDSQPEERDRLLKRLKTLAPAAKWNMNANAWHQKPPANLLDTPNITPMVGTNEDTMEYALGLDGFK